MGWGEGLPPLGEALALSQHPRLILTGSPPPLSPLLAGFWEYWNRIRRDRPMPSRQDIDPAAIPRLLPYVVLSEVLAGPPWLVYRLVGTRQVAVRGCDPTGRPVLEYYIGHHTGQTRSEVLLNYRIVIEQQTPVYDYNNVRGPERNGDSFVPGTVQERGTLLLPLSSDGRAVNMVFCCSDIDEDMSYRD